MSSMQPVNSTSTNVWCEPVKEKKLIKRIEIPTLNLPNLEDEMVPENPIDINLDLYQMEKSE